MAAGFAALALGVLLGAATGGVAVTPAGATPPAAVTVTTTVTKAVVPSVCLSAMRQGDAVIGLLDKDERDRQLGELLKSYTVAAQSCRKEVSRR
ncbi:MAG TPA: hypothetical protein VEP73_01110 [Actinomycetota bacterium]|nr:hypothetical protein [Actinomycetota bacterium]